MEIRGKMSEYIRRNGSWIPIGGVSDDSKVLDQHFNTDFTGVEGMPFVWGLNTDLTPFSIVGSEARCNTTATRGLYLPGPYKNTLQFLTVKAGTTNASNRFLLRSQVSNSEQTCLELNWIDSTTSAEIRTLTYDDGVATNTGAGFGSNTVVGNYYGMWMLTLQEWMIGGLVYLDSTDKDMRGEWLAWGSGASTLTGNIRGIAESHANYPAELQAPHSGGGVAALMAGTQNTGATPAGIERWEVWNLGD